MLALASVDATELGQFNLEQCRAKKRREDMINQ